jgi:hypothetical protein
MSMVEVRSGQRWVDICDLRTLPLNRGVCALVRGEQVALHPTHLRCVDQGDRWRQRRRSILRRLLRRMLGNHVVVLRAEHVPREALAQPRNGASMREMAPEPERRTSRALS